MAGRLARRAIQPVTYSGTTASRLRNLVLLGAAMGAALANGGCAVSGMFGLGKEQASALARAETTGSIPSPSGSKIGSGLPPEADMVYAQAAIAEVLTRGGKEVSTTWENPKTGARGTVTPISVPYNNNGVTCHDFLASYLRPGGETWIQGEACRQAEGRWEVKSMRPWKRS